MVCARCASKVKPTDLATPGIKRRTELYHGSAASSSASVKDKATKSATLGNTGVGKSKLLSKSAKNPYAAYSASCQTCKTKINQGYTYCQKCSYKANTCAMCGKSLQKMSGMAAKTQSAGPSITGQKFSAK